MNLSEIVSIIANSSAGKPSGARGFAHLSRAKVSSMADVERVNRDVKPTRSRSLPAKNEAFINPGLLIEKRPRDILGSPEATKRWRTKVRTTRKNTGLSPFNRNVRDILERRNEKTQNTVMIR